MMIHRHSGLPKLPKIRSVETKAMTLLVPIIVLTVSRAKRKLRWEDTVRRDLEFPNPSLRNGPLTGKDVNVSASPLEGGSGER